MSNNFGYVVLLPSDYYDRLGFRQSCVANGTSTFEWKSTLIGLRMRSSTGTIVWYGEVMYSLDVKYFEIFYGIFFIAIEGLVYILLKVYVGFAFWKNIRIIFSVLRERDLLYL